MTPAEARAALQSYDPATGRRINFRIKPGRKTSLRELAKRARAERLAARLVAKAEAPGAARRVDPLERIALVKRLRKPGMTDVEVNEIVRVIDGYLGGCLSAAEWRLWLRRREGSSDRRYPRAVY
jgi:hypothetical protein